MTYIIVLLLMLPLDYLANKLKMPKLIFYLFAGIILGPYALKVISFENTLVIRQAALLTIMLRSGLGLSFKALKKVGKPAILLSFLPGIIEASSIAILSTFFFDFSLTQGFILGFMIAAVSPAVVVPAMLKLQDKKIGKYFPSMILASSAVDDVVALSFFTFFTSLFFNSEVSIISNFAIIPIKMILSFALGYTIVYFIRKIKKINILIIISLAVLAIIFEDNLAISALIFILAMAMSLSKWDKTSAGLLKSGSKKVWSFVQLFLFISVGSELNVFSLKSVFFLGVIIILVGLIFRSIGIFIATYNFSLKEKVFSTIAFMPKATVQAAVATVPLEKNITGGNIMLLITILAIILTTPIGAFLIDYLSPKLLNKE